MFLVMGRVFKNTGASRSQTNHPFHSLYSVFPGIALALLFAVAEPAFCETPVLVASVQSEAELADMSLKELMDISVFRAASLMPTKHAKAPGTVYSFTKKDFKRLGVRRLDSLMRFVPGFQVNQYRKRHNAIWARGVIDRYNDKMILIVDGIRERHLYYSHFDLGDHIPLENIEKVEIILGPASSLYGADAFGGIISVTTTGFSEEEKAAVTLEGGDNNRTKGTSMYNSSNVQVFGSYLKQDAPFAPDRKSFIGGETVQPLEESYGGFNLKFKPVESTVFSINYNKNEYPYLFITDSQNAFVEETPIKITATYGKGAIDAGRIEAKLFLTQDNIREYEIENDTNKLAVEEYQNSLMAGGSLTWFKRINKHTLSASGSYQHNRATKMDVTKYWHRSSGFYDTPQEGVLLSEPEIKNNDFALFGQDVYDITDSMTLTLGGRYDKYQDFGSHFNYRTALVHSPNEHQTWKFLYGTAIRTPNYREYLKIMENTDFVPPVPEPETMQTMEIGHTYQWEQSSITATIFSNNFENYLRESPTPDDMDEYFTNSDETWNMYGLELLYLYLISDRFYARLGAGRLNAERSEQGKLPYLAEHSYSAAINYNYMDRHTAGLSLTRSGERTDTNSYTDDDPGDSTRLNLTLFGPASKTINYSFGIDNLLNERIYDPAGDFGGNYNTEESLREIWFRIETGFDI